MTPSLPVALILAAACFFFEQAGFFTHELNLLVGGLLFAGAVLYYLTASRSTSNSGGEINRRYVILAVLCLVVGLALLSGGLVARSVGLALLVFGMDAAFRSKGRERPELTALQITFVFYAFFLLFEEYVPGVFYALQGASEVVCGAVGHLPTLTGAEPVYAGTTFTGLRTIVLFGCYMVAVASLVERRRSAEALVAPRLTAALAGWRLLAVALVLYLWLFGNAQVVLDWLEPMRGGEEKAAEHPFKAFVLDVFPADFPLVLVVLCASAAAIITRHRGRWQLISGSDRSRPAHRIPRPGASGPYCLLKRVWWRLRAGAVYTVAAVVLSASAAVMLTLAPSSEPKAKPKVLFYRCGFLNFESPDYSSYGSYSAGMFGNLPKLCRLLGFEAELTAREEIEIGDAVRMQPALLRPEDLEGVDVLVTINLQGRKDLTDPGNIKKTAPPFDEGTYEAVWDFVRRGGSLLVLGDHTMRHKRPAADTSAPEEAVENVIWSNELLRPTSISYNFDSADFFVGGWLHSYRYAAHPVTLGMDDRENDVGITVGASLECEYPAVPLVTGKYGYSDRGDARRPDRGYLGETMEYDPGERLGDTILVATQAFGRGKVAVFGDTTPWVNGVATGTHPFLSRVLTFLASDGPVSGHPTFAVLAGLCVAGVGWCYYRSRRNPVNLFTPALVALTVVYVCNGAAMRSVRHLPDTKEAPESRLAYLDVGHGNRLRLESWRERGAMGLHLNLMRAGYYSANMREFAPLRLLGADLYTIIAPTQPYTREELADIDRFLGRNDRSTAVLVTVGWEDSAPAASLLEHYGFSVDDVPLGRFQVAVPGAGTNVMFWEVWPVVCDSPDAETIVSVEKTGISGRLYSLSSDGELQWDVQVGGPADAPVSVMDEMVLVPTSGTKDPITGRPGDVVAFGRDGTIKWRAHGVGAVKQPLVIAPDGKVTARTVSGRIVEIADGSLTPVPAEEDAYRAIGLGGNATRGPNGSVYGVYGDTGLVAMVREGDDFARLWTYGAAGQFSRAPVVSPDGSALVLDDEKNVVHAVSANGKELWRFSAEEGTVLWPACWGPDGSARIGLLKTPNPEVAESHGDETLLCSINPAGAKVWDTRVSGLLLGAPAVDDEGALYAATDNHAICAVGPGGELRWRFERRYDVFSPPVLGSDGSVYFAVRYRSFPLIVARDVGNGRVIVVGDTGFLHNANLETEKEQQQGMYRKPAIQFFRWLLENKLRPSGEGE